MARFEFLDHPGPLAFAHRGGAGVAPENTMPAFAAAVELGYRYLETDVHVTADGVLLAFHDAVLDRVTDRQGRIHELSWKQVSKARVDGREPIPRFEELLNTWPDIRFNIDPKHDDAVAPLAAIIERSGAVDRVCVGSFSDKRIEQISTRLGERLCTSLGPKGVARLRLASMGLPAGRFRGGCVQVPTGHKSVTIVDERFVLAAHRHGLALHIWTIDDPQEMRDLLDLGVDGIMTDLPEVLRAVLKDRQEWFPI